MGLARARLRQPDAAILLDPFVDAAMELVDAGVCGFRLRGIDHRDGLSMNHDVADFEVPQIENAAQHVPVDLHHAAFVVMKVDGPAKLLVRREDLCLVVDVVPEDAKRMTHDELYGRRHRAEKIDDEPQGLHHGKRDAVRVRDRKCLRRDLREDEHDGRHHQRRIDDAGIAEKGEEEAGRQGRCQNIDEVVAKQDRADQPFAVLGQVQHPPGALVSVLREMVHARARGSRQRRFRA